MILRQLFDRETYTYTYLIGDESTKQACLIDPVIEQMPFYLQLLKELDLSLILALDTHIHADHITALGKLRDATGCDTIIGSKGDVTCATEGFEDNKTLCIGSYDITILKTPGHTDDSYSFYVEDGPNKYLFSGDALLIRGTGRTDFQNGDPYKLYDSLHNKLLKLDSDTIVFPGHDYKGWTRSTIGEEKAHNPRLQISNPDDFAQHMNNLNLPDPKWMDVAVPANLSCGNTESNP